MIKFIAKITLLIIAAIAIGVLWQRSQLAALALTRIDPVPETRDMIAQEHYAEAADYLGFFMEYPYVQADPDAQALQRDLAAKRDSLSYQAAKLSEGILSGTSDETIGQLAGVVTDFVVIGDLRDLAKQGLNWINGEETDEVIAALAAIGVVASAAQVVSGISTVGTGGAAAPTVAATTAVKGGTVLLKAARKVGKLPPWLGKTLIKEAEIVKKTRKLDSVTDLFGDTYTLAKTRGGLTLLSKTEDAASLKRMARFAEAFGEHSATLYRIGGEALLKTAQRVGELGQDTIKLAATYGQQGIHLLDRIGTIKFVKYSARASKIAYKGDLIQLIARFLMHIPTWLLGVLAGLGMIVWIPWQWVSHRFMRSAISQPPASSKRSVAID